ncbi:hypothetical protein BD413DRAFT_591278 [Trametes elegans]|nr:hypothetical protein BD413DRAFT_591278 [Trametes elegans]
MQNDMVSLGGALGFCVVQSQTEQFLDYFLDTQDAEGWIGPEVNTSKPRSLTARYPFLLGAIRIADAKPARAERIAGALLKFVTLVHAMLRTGEGMKDEDWAFKGDLLVVVQWLYDYYPSGQEETLLNMMDLLVLRRDDEERRDEAQFTITETSYELPDVGVEWRTLDILQTFNTQAAQFRMSNDPNARVALNKSWNHTSDRRGYLPGLFVPESRNFGFRGQAGYQRMHLAVEALRTALYLHQVTGDTMYADHAERIAHNGLTSSPLTGGNGWGSVSSISLCRESFSEYGPYHAMYESKYSDPTCTSPVYPKGMGDFIHNAFLLTPDRKSIVHAYLGPFTVNATLPDGWCNFMTQVAHETCCSRTNT